MQSELDLGEVRDLAIKAALIGGGVLKEGLGRIAMIRHKGETDLVTDVDLRAEAAIVAAIRERFPEHAVLAEEGSVGGDDPDRRWIIDPLDGTTNFAHGFPFFCVSVAFALRGEPVVGVVYDPTLDETFVGVRGQGATLNGRPLAVSATADLRRSLLATGFPYRRASLGRALRQFAALSFQARAVRRVGSAALDAAYVAAGRLDGYWEAIVNDWDVAAGVVLAREAGAVVTDLAGRDFQLGAGEICVASPGIHAALLGAVQMADHEGAGQ